MNIVVCVDNKMGTMFNKRRQSRDSVLCQKIADLVGSAALYLTSYSFPLFQDLSLKTIVAPNCLSVAGKGDFCFVEGEALASYTAEIEKLILCKWNRDYPSDQKLDIDHLNNWTLESSEDFVGSSHPKITLEIYNRR